MEIQPPDSMGSLDYLFFSCKEIICSLSLSHEHRRRTNFGFIAVSMVHKGKSPIPDPNL